MVRGDGKFSRVHAEPWQQAARIPPSLGSTVWGRGRSRVQQRHAEPPQPPFGKKPQSPRGDPPHPNRIEMELRNVSPDGITPPLSVPCAVCGSDRLYVLEVPAPSPPRWSLFRRPVPREPRCLECGAT